MQAQIGLACEDRLEVEFGEWFFVGDDADLQLALIALREQTVPVFPEQGEPAHLLFQAPQGSLRNQVYSFRRQQIGSPLLAGKMRVRQIEGDEYGPSRYVINFLLSLNPTRALNNQILHPQIARLQPVTEYPGVSLEKRVNAPFSFHEVVFDGGDNVVLARRRDWMARHPHWRVYRNRYLEQVDSFLSGLMHDAFAACEHTGYFRREPRFNLKEAETFWEFRSDDPVRLVTEMAPHFRSLGTDSSNRIYSNVVFDSEYRGNSPVLRCQLVTGVNAKVYAKTSRRIRVEITYDFRRTQRVATSHVMSTLFDMYGLIDLTAQHAAEETSTLLRTLERALPSTGPQKPVYDFVRKVVLAAPDPSVHEPLLSILVNNNGIRLRSGDQFRSPSERLVRAGVLERTRPASTYFRIVECYQSARDILAAQTANPTDDSD